MKITLLKMDLAAGFYRDSENKKNIGVSINATDNSHRVDNLVIHVEDFNNGFFSLVVNKKFINIVKALKIFTDKYEYFEWATKRIIGHDGYYSSSEYKHKAKSKLMKALGFDSSKNIDQQNEMWSDLRHWNWNQIELNGFELNKTYEL